MKMRDEKGHFIKGHTGYKFWLGKKFPLEAIEKSRLKKLGKPSWNKGMKMSSEFVKTVSNAHIGINKGKENYRWVGEKAAYRTLHNWVERELGKSSYCSFCKKTDLKRYHWANVSGLYKRDLSDWIRLCVKCHKEYDKYRTTSASDFFNIKGKHYSTRKEGTYYSK
jgi:hypothetical protein